MVDGTDRANSWRLPDPLDHLLVEEWPQGRPGFSRAGNRDDHREQVVRVESRVDGPQSEEAANHQACADEQDQGKGKFRSHEHAAQTVATDAFTRSAFPFFHRAAEVGSDSPESRRQSEDKSRAKCYSKHKQ